MAAKKQMTAGEWFAAADEFSRAAWMLRQEAAEKEVGTYLPIPHVVNRAFGTEAYLKCLLTLRAKHFPPEHDLHLLFRLLPSEDKRVIEEWWNAETLPHVLRASQNPPPDLHDLPTTFGQALKRSRNAFKEWRYRTKEVMYWYLGGFPANVRRRILEINPQWNASPPKTFPGDPKS